jgi:hypothetical protein
MVIFSNQKSNLGLAMEVVGTVFVHLVYLLPFGIFYGHLIYFLNIRYIFPVLVRCSQKNLATLARDTST